MSKLRKVFKAVALYLSMLMPRSKKIIIFGSWFGEKFADNPKYLFLSMLKDKSKKCVWITKSKAVYDDMKKQGLPVFMYDSADGIWLQLRAKYAVVCTGRMDVNEFCLGNAVFINLWHGIPLKKIMYDDDKVTGAKLTEEWKRSIKIKNLPLRKVYYLPTSGTYKKIYQSAFRMPAEKLIVGGQPRNDMFFDESYGKLTDKVFEGKKIVLYLPTHREGGKKKIDLENIFDLPKLNKLMQDSDSLFVIKKHFYHDHEGNISGKYSNVVDLTGENYDTQLLMKNADVLVTDYSSCYIDYLLTDRPIVFYNYDIKNYLMNDREMYFPYDEVTPGFRTEHFDDLYDYLSNYLVSGKDGFEQERESVCGLFYDVDARRDSCEKLKEKINSGVFK